MRGVKLALAGAIVLIVLAVCVSLSRSPPVLAGTNSVSAVHLVGESEGKATVCQREATVPQGTSAVRVSLGAGAGPSVRVTISSGSRLVSQGERPSGWGLTANVVVPVAELRHAVQNARICTTVEPDAEPVKAYGVPGPGANGGSASENLTLRLEYLRSGSQSWWSLLPSIFHRIGLGHAVSGAWLAFFALALALAALALALRLTWSELR
jgi:hypothetical protein